MADERKRAVSGRIGGLTIALGLGAAIASGGTGVAWATPDSSSSDGGVASPDASASTGTTSANGQRPPGNHDSDSHASQSDRDTRKNNVGASHTDGKSGQAASRATQQIRVVRHGPLSPLLNAKQFGVAAPQQVTVLRPDEAESATAAPNVADTYDRSRNDRVSSQRADSSQITKPARLIGLGDNNIGGTNVEAIQPDRLQSGDLIARSGGQLRSVLAESGPSRLASVEAVDITSPAISYSVNAFVQPSGPAERPAGAIAQLVSTFVNAVFGPAALADATPQTPTVSPALWTLLAFARREFDRTVSGFTPTAIATPTISTSQGINTVPSGLTVDAAKGVAPIPEDLYTGHASLIADIIALGAKALNTILLPFGGILAGDTLRIPFITNGVPPPFSLYGLHVTHTEFEGMPVTTLTPRHPTDMVVVAIHGGAFVGKASIFHWWTYANMARQTDATVVVPDYTLSPAGTAETEVPRMADFISEMNAEQGAKNVSVLGDSSGGGLALLAVQDLVRRDSATPGHLVLLAPWLDVSMSDPRSAEINDPLLNVKGLTKYGKLWAGDLSTQDPRVSPLFGSLDGLPPTVVYSSSRDLLTVDTLRLRDRVLAEDIPNVTFRLRKGELHDFVIYAPLPDAKAERTNLYNDLDLLGSTLP